MPDTTEQPARRAEAAWLAWAGAIAVTWTLVHWPLATVDAVLPPGVVLRLQEHAFRGPGPIAGIPALAALFGCALFAGGALVRSLGAAPCGPAETLAFALAFGLGAIGTAGALAGLPGAFFGPVLAGLAAVLGLAGLAAGDARREVLAALFELPRAVLRLVWGGPAIALALLAMLLLKASAPPWYPDALFYHLALPRIFLDAGAIVPVPGEPINGGHPALAQMLFAFPMAFGSDHLCAVLSLALSAAGLVASAALAAEAGGARAGRLALVALAAVPHLMFVAATPLADGPLFAFVALALLAAVRAVRQDCAGWARAASLAMGFALATKYHAALPVALLAVALGAGFARRRGLAGALNLAAPCAALALVPFLPWAFRNVLHFENPLYPLVLTASTPAPVRALFALFRADWVTHGHGASLLFLPIDLTFFARPDDLAAYEGEIGPALLALAPLALVALARGPRRAPLAWALAAFVLPQWLLWVNGAREVRYLFPLLPAYVALALAALGDEHSEGSPPIPLGPVLAGCALVSAGWLVGHARPGIDLLFAAGAESREEYLQSLSSTGPLFRAGRVLGNARAARALFFWDDRGYYCPVPYLADHLLPASSSHVLHELPAEPRALRRRFADLGVSHLLVNRIAWQEAVAAKQPWEFGPALDAFLSSGQARLLYPPAEVADSAPSIEVWQLR